jgi:hypothetical protein
LVELTRRRGRSHVADGEQCPAPINPPARFDVLGLAIGDILGAG